MDVLRTTEIDSQVYDRFPDVDHLTAVLRKVLSAKEQNSDNLVVLSRQHDTHRSTFPNEIITCRVDGDKVLHLFCKYSAGFEHNVHGHRGGIAYEAEVYRHILQKSAPSVPIFYDEHRDATTSWSWLVLEYLDGSDWFTRARDPLFAITEAARWIGKFHAANESTTALFLNRYTDAYYRGWVHRTLQFAAELQGDFPWLDSVCRAFEEYIPSMREFPNTVIHGEFYRKNVLLRDGVVYPVDWESAAIAFGEVDLAALTDKWPQECILKAEQEYKRSRWPRGAPDDFDTRLAAARLYLQLRWLGDRPHWTTKPKNARRFQEIRLAAQKLGLMSSIGME